MDSEAQAVTPDVSPAAMGASVQGAPRPSYRSILPAKVYKRRRLYKLAWKSLLTTFEDMDSESDGSDDLLDDSDEEDGVASVAPKRHGPFPLRNRS